MAICEWSKLIDKNNEGIENKAFVIIEESFNFLRSLIYGFYKRIIKL